MTGTLTPAAVFPPGEFLRDELDERGWTIAEFAEIIGRPVQAVSEIISGHKSITPEIAAEVGHALGTSAALWLNLQTAYRRRSTSSRSLGVGTAAVGIHGAPQRARRAGQGDPRPLGRVRYLTLTEALIVAEATTGIDPLHRILTATALSPCPRVARGRRRWSTSVSADPPTGRSSAPGVGRCCRS